jgi:hypothetical protein
LITRILCGEEYHNMLMPKKISKTHIAVYLKKKTNWNSMFLLSLSWSLQLSHDVPPDAGFLSDKADVLSENKTKTPQSWIGYRPLYF